MEHHSGNKTAYLIVARALLESGDFEGAEKTATEGLSVSPSYAELINLRALAYIRMEKFPEAFEDAQLYAALKPDTAWA